MNTELAQAGIAAVTDDNLDPNPNYPSDPGVKRKGMCSRFCRCATRKVYKQKYQGLFGGSAIVTGHNFKDAGLTVPKGQPLAPGDFLIKMQGSGGFGHIEMYVGTVVGNGTQMTAGNSSTSIGRVSGAKGFRTLAQFGNYDLVARLPLLDKPDAAKSLYLGERFVCSMPILDGSSWCPCYRWAEILGFDLDWDDVENHVIFNGKEVNAPTRIIDGRAYVAIANLVSSAGLRIVSNDGGKVVVSR